MRKIEIVDSFGDTIVVEPELGLYTAYDFMENKMPNLGIQFYSYDEDGYRDPYATLTVNFGEFIGAKDCAYIDTNNNSFTAQLLQIGFCQDTGFTKQSGFCTYPLWKFDTNFLKEIDVNGLYDAYEKKFDEYMNDGPSLPVQHIEADNSFLTGLSDEELAFVGDEEKMVDFAELTKEEFLASYSYLTEEEYDATKRVLALKNTVSLEDKIATAGQRSLETKQGEVGKEEFEKA